MADGDLILLDQHILEILLLDAHNAASAGPWVETPPHYNIRSLHCNVAGTDTVNIEVSNAISLPSSSTSGSVFCQLTGTNGTTTSSLLNNSVYATRWMRAVKAGTAATSTVILCAARNE